MSVALKKIHIGAKQLGLDDDTKRDIYLRVTGKSSARDMSESQREAVVDELVKKGFKPSSNTRRDGRKKLEGAFAKKLQALWIAAWNLGIIDNKDDAAMLAFVKRQTKLDHTRFLRHPEDAAKAIEGLKAWIAREANVEWSRPDQKKDFPVTRLSGYRIAEAQWCRLHNCAIWDGAQSDAFRTAIKCIASAHWHELRKERDWMPVMNELGNSIRKQKAAA